jgi:hypothetical protein
MVLNQQNITPSPQGEEAVAGCRDPAATVTNEALPGMTPGAGGGEGGGREGGRRCLVASRVA